MEHAIHNTTTNILNKTYSPFFHSSTHMHGYTCHMHYTATTYIYTTTTSPKSFNFHYPHSIHNNNNQTLSKMISTWFLHIHAHARPHPYFHTLHEFHPFLYTTTCTNTQHGINSIFHATQHTTHTYTHGLAIQVTATHSHLHSTWISSIFILHNTLKHS